MIPLCSSSFVHYLVLVGHRCTPVFPGHSVIPLCRLFFSERKEPWRVCARCVNPRTFSTTDGYEAKPVLPLFCVRSCCLPPFLDSPGRTWDALYPTMRKVVYVASILYAVTRPSVLLASSFQLWRPWRFRFRSPKAPSIASSTRPSGTLPGEIGEWESGQQVGLDVWSV